MTEQEERIRKYTPKNFNTNIGHGGEHVVINSLIKQGIVPFRSELPSSEVDLMALIDDQVYKIQVKTSQRNERGSLHIDLRRSNRKNSDYRKESFDILAIVDADVDKVAYIDWNELHPRTKLTLRTDTYKGNINENFGSKGFDLFDRHLDFPLTKELVTVI